MAISKWGRYFVGLRTRFAPHYEFDFESYSSDKPGPPAPPPELDPEFLAWLASTDKQVCVLVEFDYCDETPAPIVPTVQFSTASETADCNAGAFTIQVTLSAASASIVTVPFSVSGTAVDPDDYSYSPASPLVFAPGETSKNVTITPVACP